MNREIKFRAFCKNKNIPSIYYVLGIDFEGGHSHERIIKQVKLNDGNWHRPGEVELMQCTLLRDKNGKEIYEGDIVKDDDWDIKSKCVIEWNKCGFDKKDHNGECWSIWKSEMLEVVGNVWENPELL